MIRFVYHMNSNPEFDSFLRFLGIDIPVKFDPELKNAIRLVNPDGTIAAEAILYTDPYPEPSE